MRLRDFVDRSLSYVSGFWESNERLNNYAVAQYDVCKLLQLFSERERRPSSCRK
jgi:hypothetical protein